MKRHLKETLFFYALACALNYYVFPNDIGFISYKLHPYLFATILFGMRYGIWEGLLSAVLGAGIITWATIQQNNMLEMEILYGIEHLVLPIIIVVLGILIGEITESRIKKTKYYQSALKREVASNMSKTKVNMGLEESLLQLEKKLAGHSLGIRNFSEELTLMTGMSRDQIYDRIPEILKTFLQVKHSLILTSEPDVYQQEMVSSIEHPLTEEQIDKFRQHPLYKKAIQKQGVVSLTEIIDDVTLDSHQDHSIYYAGVVTGERGHIDAIVLILDLPFIQFNITNLRLFEVILKAASMIIRNQQAYTRLLESSPYHAQWLIERSHYFYKHMPDLFIQSSHQEKKLLLAGFSFAKHTNESMIDGFNTALSQLCLKTGARVGLIEPQQIFLLYHPRSDAKTLKEDLSTRFNSYGFSESFARLHLVEIEISEKLQEREMGHWIHLCQSTFEQAERT